MQALPPQWRSAGGRGAGACGEVLATGRNAPVAAHDPTAHAEIAAPAPGRRRWATTGWVTARSTLPWSPAPCSGAMLHARLARVVFGAPTQDRRRGSVLDLFANARINHQTQVQGGVLAPSAALLEDFQTRRSARHAGWLRTPVPRCTAYPQARSTCRTTLGSRNHRPVCLVGCACITLMKARAMHR